MRRALVTCILLFTLGVVLATPQNKRLSSILKFGFQRWPIRYKQSKSHEPIYKTAKRISTVTHLAGSTTGARWHRSYDLYLHSLPSPDEDTKNQRISPVAGFVGGAIRPRVLNNEVDCRVWEMQHQTTTGY